jgi:hypothetical protein
MMALTTTMSVYQSQISSTRSLKTNKYFLEVTSPYVSATISISKLASTNMLMIDARMKKNHDRES